MKQLIVKSSGIAIGEIEVSDRCFSIVYGKRLNGVLIDLIREIPCLELKKAFKLLERYPKGLFNDLIIEVPAEYKFNKGKNELE